MAHWAEINESNVVLRVVVTDNNDLNNDEGYQWLIDNLGGNWIKTSYTSIGGKRRNIETGEIIEAPAFRKNFAGINFTYDQERDAFIPPKPFNSWILDEDTCLWKAPVECPQSEYTYYWNEDLLEWIQDQ